MTFRLDVSAETSYSFLKLIFQDELGHLATTEALLIDLIHDRNGNFAIDAIRLEPIELVVLDQWNGTAASSSYKRPWMRHDRIHDGGHPGGPEFLQRLRSAILPSLVGIMAGLLACTVGFALGWIGIAAYTCLACLVGRTKCRSGASKLGEVDEDEEEELSSEACVGSKMERALPWSPAL